MSFISSSFIVKVVNFTAAVILSLPLFSQDTTIKFNVPYRFVVQGTRSGSITIPLPKNDTIRIHDTVYIYNCPPMVKDSLVWSKFNGTFQEFVDSAVKNNTVAYIDKDVTPIASVNVDGDLTLIGNADTVTNINKYLFILGTGKHTFINFNIIQTRPDGVAFFTRQVAGILWENTLKDVNIEGGGDGYLSARGGNDTSWARTTIENSIIKVKSVGITIFSQDGPYKNLHLKNVQIKTDTTHNIYVHPNVSLWYDSVASLGAGKLMQHQYSGTKIGYNTAKYSRFSRVYSNNESFEMTNPKEGFVEIDNCELAPYVTMGVPPARVWATNSKFYNAGSGILLAGTLFNCRGGAWPTAGDTLKLVGGVYDEVSMRSGGTLITDNATINYMSVADRGNEFEGFINNGIIKNLYDGRNGNGVLNLLNTPRPAPAYGQLYRPEIVNSLNR